MNRERTGGQLWPKAALFKKIFTAELFSKQDLTPERHYMKQLKHGFAADEARVGGLLLTPPRTLFTEGSGPFIQS